MNFIWDIIGLALDVIDTHERQQSGCVMLFYPVGAYEAKRI